MRRPAPATVQTIHIPAPVGGLNTVAAGTAMPEGDCIQLVNMVSGEHGLRARLGYRWASDSLLGGARSLLPFIGAPATGTGDRIFPVTRATIGVINPTSGAASGLATFATAARDSPLSGRGVAHAFTTSAGPFLLYCDGYNGYYVYTPPADPLTSNGSFSKVAFGGGAGEVTGVDPGALSFVMVWKSRVWFVERNSQNLWYLDAGAIYGTATKLALAQGAQFRHGGPIVGIWNWTLDGGAGIDDHLVVATAGGDVAVYQGTDPDSATTFSLKGTWHAGALVAGSRVATNFGGDVLFLTKSGIRPLSQLVSGGEGEQTYATAKITNLFSRLAQERGDLPGWDICVHPEEGVLLVTVPKLGADDSGNYETEQLALSLVSRGWSRFSGVPIQSMCIYKKGLYFTDRSTDAEASGFGALWKATGHVDAHRAQLATPTLTAIQWALLTAFTDFGGPLQKQVQVLRPVVLSESTMNTVRAEPRYNYNLASIADQTETSATGNVWDAGTWDSATWDEELSSKLHTQGATGMGSKVAISVKGTARSRTVLVGIDVAYTTGGLL